MARTPLIVRFLSKVRMPSADPDVCWEWMAATNRQGYGCIWSATSGQMVGAHRVGWEVANGPIPSGMVIRHKCDNPVCVRPSHLEIGTDADNNRDMAVRKRGAHSKAGLPYGVYRDRRKWVARPYLGGCKRYLGTYDTIAEAAVVAQQEREKRL